MITIIEKKVAFDILYFVRVHFEKVTIEQIYVRHTLIDFFLRGPSSIFFSNINPKDSYSTRLLE